MSKSAWFKWSLVNFGSKGFMIRRYRTVHGKPQWETYPKKKYKDLSQDEVEKLLKRLNATREQEEAEARKKYDYGSAYVNELSLAEFEALLATRSNKTAHVSALMQCLHTHSLKFFIKEKGLPNPNGWKKYEHEFGAELLKKELSAAHIVRITQTTNRLIKFLYMRHQEELKFFELDPVSVHVLKDIKTVNTDRLKYISPENYKAILKGCSPSIKPAIELAYAFGLRRAEVLGLSPDDVYEESLSLSRQLIKLLPVKTFDDLKNKEKRDVMYWYSTPEETYGLIESLPEMHPDTMSDIFVADMKRLGLPFKFHDLRRTWITNSLRKHHYRDVQLGAGHADLKTTQGYAQDDRDLNKKKFKPKKAS